MLEFVLQSLKIVSISLLLYRTADPDEMPRYVVLRLRDHSVYGYPVYTPDMRQSKTILNNRRTRIKNR